MRALRRAGAPPRWLLLAAGLGLGALGPAPAAASADLLQLSGGVSGLYPGASKTMVVQVRNGHRHPARLLRLDARSTHGVPGCPPTQVVARPLRPGVVVAAQATASVAMRIGLRRSAPDACQGATFPLHLVARARVRPAAGTPRPGSQDGSGPRSGDGSASPSGEAGGTGLPLTGLDLALIALAGSALVASGGVARVGLARGRRQEATGDGDPLRDGR